MIQAQVALLFVCLFVVKSWGASALKTPAWPERLQKTFAEIHAGFKGNIGLYVRENSTGRFAGVDYDRAWYYSSAIKIPIAIEVLKQIEAGKLSFDQTIVFSLPMRRDGSGETSYRKSGTPLTIRYLLDQMLIESDNASSDMLIRRTGLKRINETLKKLVPNGFSPITSLLDVRRLAYGELHPAAAKLGGNDYIDIKTKWDYRKRYEHFAKLIQVPLAELRQPNLESAFEAYYAKGYNSGTLQAYADLLQLLAEKKAVSPFVSDEVFKIMSRCKTGKNRLKAHFPPGYKFAHKTGTQIQRLCDFGILTVPSGATFSIGACAEKFTSLREAEAAFATAGRAIARELPR